MYGLDIITPNNTLVVSVAQLHPHVRLNDSTEDGLLADWIKAATDQFINQSNYVPLTTTFRVNLDGYPKRLTLVLPRYPVTSLTSVEYLDTAGTWQTLSGCTSDLTSKPCRVLLPTTALPPLHETQRPRFRAQFVAGHATPEVVPANIRQAVKLLAAHMYRYREAYDPANLKAVANGWQSIVNMYRINIQADLWQTDPVPCWPYWGECR